MVILHSSLRMEPSAGLGHRSLFAAHVYVPLSSIPATKVVSPLHNCRSPNENFITLTGSHQGSDAVKNGTGSEIKINNTEEPQKKEKEKRFSSVKVIQKSKTAKQKYGNFRKWDQMKKSPAAISLKKEKMLEARRKRRAKGKVLTTVASFIPIIIIVHVIKIGNLESDVQYSRDVISKERE